ncbi:RNA recognition motif domain-containing protein [Candidatus Margulisiibacteriota bacterium]
MNIYVGNLSYSVTNEKLKEIFGEFGEVVNANIITDKFTKRSKGFGFVEMTNKEEAEKAIAELNEKEIDGRALRVNEARPREERPERKPRF